jgi:hypothetical protein
MPQCPQVAHRVELIYKVNLKSSVFFAYQGFQAPEAVLSGFPESLALLEFQRLYKSARKATYGHWEYSQLISRHAMAVVCGCFQLSSAQTYPDAPPAWHR